MELLVTGWLHRAGCTCWRPKSRCAKWLALLQRIEDQAADVDGYGYPAHGVHSFQPIVNPSNGTEQGAVHGMISRHDPSSTSTIVQERSGNPRLSTRPGLLILHRKVPRWPLNVSWALLRQQLLRQRDCLWPKQAVLRRLPLEARAR